MVCSVAPFKNASAYTNGLKADPGWRPGSAVETFSFGSKVHEAPDMQSAGSEFPCQFLEPTMARISPVRGSIATSAALCAPYVIFCSENFWPVLPHEILPVLGYKFVRDHEREMRGFNALAGLCELDVSAFCLVCL